MVIWFALVEVLEDLILPQRHLPSGAAAELYNEQAGAEQHGKGGKSSDDANPCN
jgi:hypothetical protein